MTATEAEREIARELRPDERLLWSGAPAEGVRFGRGDAVLVPFSLLWGGFAIYWEATVIASGAPWFFVLWGIPFVLVGLYLIAGRFFVDAAVRARTAYGLTDQRVVVVSGLRSRSVSSLALTGLPEPALEEAADGSGTITFGPGPPPRWWPGGLRGRRGGGIAFEMVSRAREVYSRVRDARGGV
jgi:hypothetical protein